MKHNSFEVFSDGLRFVYEKNCVFVYNAEGTHNLIQSYERSGIDTKMDFEVEVSFWLYENNVQNV